MAEVAMNLQVTASRAEVSGKSTETQSPVLLTLPNGKGKITESV